MTEKLIERAILKYNYDQVFYWRVRGDIGVTATKRWSRSATILGIERTATSGQQEKQGDYGRKEKY